MQCNKCGANIVDGSVYCNGCGMAVADNDKHKPNYYTSTPTDTQAATKDKNVSVLVRLLCAIVPFLSVVLFLYWQRKDTNKALTFARLITVNYFVVVIIAVLLVLLGYGVLQF